MLLRKPSESVGIKLFLIISGAVVLLTAALGLISYQVSKNLIRQEVGLASAQAINQAADKLDFLFAEYEALSRQLAVDSVLKQDLEAVNDPVKGTYDKNQSADRIKKKLDGLVGSDARLLAVRLVAQSLVDSASYKSAGVANLRSDQEVEERIGRIRAADGEPVWFPSMKTGFFGHYREPTLTMGRLLKNKQRPEAEYILLIEIKEAALGDVLSGIKLGTSGQIRILAGDNRIVHAKDQELLETEAFIRVDKDRVAAADGNHYFITPDEAGVPQLVVFGQLVKTGWTMIGYAPERDFVGAADRLLYITLIIMLVAVAVAVCIGIYLIRRIGGPLQRLMLLMEQGEQGNLQARAGTGGKDEIGRLGNSFNKMLSQISVLVQRTGRTAGELAEMAEEVAQASRNTAKLAGEVAGVTEEIAAGAYGLAHEADNGNQALIRTGVFMEQVASVNEVMNQAAARVIGISAQGGEYFAGLQKKTEVIVQLTGRIQDNSRRLERSTHSIRSILAPMAAMTKQTHILSLNASIEAARVGVAGRGFMVIAEEIRQLAAKSSDSLRFVSDMVEGIESDIANTVSVLGETTPLFSGQLQSAGETAAFFQDVRKEMERLIGYIHTSSGSVAEMVASRMVLETAVDNVRYVVQETSASTQQVATMSSEQFAVSEQLVSLSESLERLADKLNSTLAHFQTGSN